MDDDRASIPFSFFVSLIHEIAKIRPRRAGTSPSKPASQPSRAVQLLERWILELQSRFSRLHSDTVRHFFRLFFPEEDVRRKYELQETRLAKHLANIFLVSTSHNSRGARLRSWKGENTLGCLGDEVRTVLEASSTDADGRIGHLSLAQVDLLLDELASISAFSDASFRARSSVTHRNRIAILHDLYSSMPALDASCLTQIILKDLRPLLYPLVETHFTASLIQYNSAAASMISKEDAMKAWDPSGRMLKMYRVRTSLEEVSLAFSRGGHELPLEPQVGIPVAIPKCVKGGGCAQALAHFQHSPRVWAETKYDGERMQIHITIDEHHVPQIKIFSKSKRDSTLDRIATHWIIYDALGVTHKPTNGHLERHAQSRVVTNVILEAEMVAFSDSLNRIDEFWRVRSLVESTAHGVRGARSRPAAIQSVESQDNIGSQCSLVSNASDGGTRHLAVVFFDILVLNNVSLLNMPYCKRRAILESIVSPIPGYAMLAERSPIPLRTIGGIKDAASTLQRVFAARIADHQEGLVLKADDGRYNDWRVPWVKLKRDYIPGYGDTLDLVLLAAGWNKERGRELRVAPTTYTTFYVGVLANADAAKVNPSVRPHFQLYFTVSYGLGREQLEELNFLVKSSEPIPYSKSSTVIQGLSYTFDLFSELDNPDVVFQKPFLAELYGAGFTKAAKSEYYELRFPRLTKVFRSGERCWTEGTTLQELDRIARQKVGRDRPNKDVDDWCNDVWGKVSSPGVRCQRKRKAAEEHWQEKLKAVDDAKIRPRQNSRTAAVRATPLINLTGDNDGVEGAGAAEEKDKGTPKKAAALHPLGSMTNITGSSVPSLSPSDYVTPPPKRRRVATQKNATEVFPNTPIRLVPHTRHRDTTQSKTDLESKNNIDENAIHHENCSVMLISANDTALPLTPVSPHKGSRIVNERRELVIPQPSLDWSPYADRPIVKFLADALVWLARPCNAARPSWRPACRQLIPENRQIHSLESFLIGCGWHTDCAQYGTFPWVQYGVIFVDDSDEAGRLWKASALDMIKQRRKELSNQRLKPIWIFEARMLRFEVLRAFDGDAKDHAFSMFD